MPSPRRWTSTSGRALAPIPNPGWALQRETARERLLAFAALQQTLAQEGWQTITCEGHLPDVTVEGIAPDGKKLGTVKVGGRFDRLDFNP